MDLRRPSGQAALNGAILQQFADPGSLTPDSFEHFEKRESPHLRFERICLAVGREGGLAFVARGISERLIPHWHRVIGTRPRFHELPDGNKILDLREIGGINSRHGALLAEHAEHEIMRFLAASVPGLTVTIGADDMKEAGSPFINAWSGHSWVSDQPPSSADFQVTAIGDERHASRDRAYAVRFVDVAFTDSSSTGHGRAMTGSFSTGVIL